MTEILEYLQYGFVQRALIAGTFISLLCSLLGVLLVLRRLSLIGDGLSHVTFGSVALGLALKTHPLTVSLPVVMLSSVGILKLAKRAGIYGDAAIGVVSSLGIATGVLLASSTGGFNVDIFSYLFGNILAISETEVYTSIALSVAALAVIYLYYEEIFAVTFDEDFARASGINTERINTLLVLLTSVTVVLAMKVVGIMLTSALLILPAVTAFQVARGFRHSLTVAASSAVLSVFIGTCVSFAFNLPTGALIVLANVLFFGIAFSIRILRRI